MKFTSFLFAATLFSDVAIGTLVAPPAAELETHQPVQNAKRDESSHEDLWKRKGGGGGGGRGGGGGGRGGSSGGRGGSGSAGRNTPTPAYGGGRYYGGGAARPYKAGGTSPSGIVPVFVAASFLAFWPGVWLYGAHRYRYEEPYTFFNATTQRTESKPVDCACSPRGDCGCDENRDKSYLDDLIGNGSYAALNKTLVNVADVDGKSTILVNGTLPEGTADAFGSGAGDGLRDLVRHAGWWPVAAAVCAIVFAA